VTLFARFAGKHLRAELPVDFDGFGVGTCTACTLVMML
jgi:hypothetical protein